MKSKHIAESGILIALTLVVLYATSLLPISTLSVLTISSCLIPICIIRTSIKNAFLVYACSSILSLMIIPINILLKLLTFNVLLLIIYFIMTAFIGNIVLPYSLHIVFILAQIMFLVYDYALTLIITIYFNKIHKLL